MTPLLILPDLSPSGIAYLAVYLISLGSTLAIFYAVFSSSRKSKTPLTINRLLLLTKDETRRLSTLDSIFLMHLSIVLGVGLSILTAILDPLWSFIPILRLIVLAISIPLIAGLVWAFAWRVQRLGQSRGIEKELHSDSKFVRASDTLQLVLIIAIGFTTTELILGFFLNFAVVDMSLNVIRNLLVVFYYATPSVNLIGNFDRPLPSMRLPFKLSDVLEGKIDASQIKAGVGQMSEFEDYQKLSYDSCVEIGVCESSCPATAAGRPLSPRVLVRKIELLQAQKGASASPFETIQEDELWSCVSCGACVSTCPISVKHLDIIYELRRNLVNSGKLDKDKSTLLQNLTQNQNPYGFNSGTRADWATSEGIDLFSSNPKADYLYWVGCVSSFDQRAQKIAKSLSKIMKSAGVCFAILGSEELCNGDPARRLGEEGRFQELAYQNIEKINSYRIKKVITSCPHCFNTFKNEYPLLGGNFEVIHHSQLISELIEGGKIKIPESKLREISVTLHDACYAVRYNSIFEEPRKVLRSASKDLREMHRHGDKTFCCGAGGSNYWYKVPQQRTISGIRTEEAAKTGASTLATECPFCLSMFEDSTRVSGTKMDVKDIAEIVAEELTSS
jgi:dimethylglycine catabolism B